jgi:hypothetical protein
MIKLAAFQASGGALMRLPKAEIFFSDQTDCFGSRLLG